MVSFAVLLLITVVPGWALAPAQMKALDDAVRAARPSASAGRAAAEFRDRVDNLEKRMLPLALMFNRLGPALVQRLNEFESVRSYLKKGATSFVNPYVDQKWVESARRETGYVCCDVRRSPRLALEIQENLAQGLPALSDNMSDKVGNRARMAASGRQLIEYGGEAALAPGGPPPGAIPQRRGAGPPSAASKGLSTGLISGLPAPSGTPSPNPQGQGFAPQMPMQAVPPPPPMPPPVPPSELSP